MRLRSCCSNSCSTCNRLTFAWHPTFARSDLVGGADADLIVDGCLVELKTTAEVGLTSAIVRQLIGYVLLDEHDTYNIERVSILFARRPQALSWNADELMERCGAKRPLNRERLRHDMESALQRAARS